MRREIQAVHFGHLIIEHDNVGLCLIQGNKGLGRISVFQDDEIVL